VILNYLIDKYPKSARDQSPQWWFMFRLEQYCEYQSEEFE
jgi:hypothetical protein